MILTCKWEIWSFNMWERGLICICFLWPKWVSLEKTWQHMYIVIVLIALAIFTFPFTSILQLWFWPLLLWFGTSKHLKKFLEFDQNLIWNWPFLFNWNYRKNEFRSDFITQCGGREVFQRQGTHWQVTPLRSFRIHGMVLKILNLTD